MNIQVDPTSSNLASAMLNSKIRPRAVVGYGVKIFHLSPPNYVTRSPGRELLMVKLLEQGHGFVRNSSLFSTVNALVDPVATYGAGSSIQVKRRCVFRIFVALSEVNSCYYS